MTGLTKTCALAIFAAGIGSAATVSTTMTVTASGPFSLSGATLTGTAAFTNGVGNGSFSAAVSLTSLDSSGNFAAPFTVTFSAGNAINGTIALPSSILTGALNASATAKITGGTGTYSGATGSFALSGSGSLSTTTVTVNFSGPGSITTGATGPTATPPAITAVQDAASYTAALAAGSIFVVKGTNLSPSGLGSGGVLSFGFPLPANSNGVSINFTPASGGSATSAYLVYLYNASGTNQLAAILPSSLAPGNYNVTVTNAGVSSAPFVVSVVKSKPAMFTLDQAGDGLAIVQNFVSASQTDEDLYVNGVLGQSTVSPAYPGQTLIAWATGLGPITTGDNTAAPVLNVASSSNVQVIVGGVAITPAFAGRAPGLAGEDQIDFVLPANVPTGCAVSFQISANGVTSAPTYIAIAPNSTAGACVQPGFTLSQLQALQNGLFSSTGASTITGGSFLIENISITETLPTIGTTTETIGAAAGEFVKYTGFQLDGYTTYANIFAANNSCQVIPLAITSTLSTTSPSPSPIPTGSAALLDAGKVTLTGPTGSGITGLPFTETANVYSLPISEQIPGLPTGIQNNGSIIGGQYVLNGSGGKDVGPFTGMVNLGSPLTITGGLPSTVNRGAGLTLKWTGGNSSDLVIIEGLAATASSTTTASGTTYTENGAEFICTTTAGTGGFTVPASITSQFPALNPASSTTGSALSTLSVFSATNPSNGNGIFTAPLTAGGNVSAYFLGYMGSTNTPIWQ